MQHHHHHQHEMDPVGEDFQEEELEGGNPPHWLTQPRTHKLGPIELSILERLEVGLTSGVGEESQGDEESNQNNQNRTEGENRQNNTQSENQDKEAKNNEFQDLSFTGDKEILHIEGWMKESGIVNRYIFEIVFKLILGVVGFIIVMGPIQLTPESILKGLKSHHKKQPKVTFVKNKHIIKIDEAPEERHIERWWIICSLALAFCLIHILKSLYFLIFRRRRISRSLDLDKTSDVITGEGNSNDTDLSTAESSNEAPTEDSTAREEVQVPNTQQGLSEQMLGRGGDDGSETTQNQASEGQEGVQAEEVLSDLQSFQNELKETSSASLDTINSVLRYEILFNLSYSIYLLSLILYLVKIEDTFEIGGPKPNKIPKSRRYFLILSPFPLLLLSIIICVRKHKEYSYTVKQKKLIENFDKNLIF